MKRILPLLLAFLMGLSLAGCSKEAIVYDENVKYDRIPMVMVNGKMYYSTGRCNNTPHCGVMDGQITSAVEGWEIPVKDNQSNFGKDYGYQFASENTIEVYMDGNFCVFEYGSGEGKIRFGNTWFDKGFLSDETLQWLQWYNSLPSEAQASVSSIPPELVKPEDHMIISNAKW